MEILKQVDAAAAPAFNEAKIRFHIIDPIVRALGYASGEDVYLILEEVLEYPYTPIGRRSKRDLPVGRADYRAGLKGDRGSFVIEAKAGPVPLGRLEVEQAHSYAAHPQVGANFFALCNGDEFRLYETLSGPNAVPVLNIPLAEVNDRYHELENVLSPRMLAKHCQVIYDKGLKLAAGLPSSVDIASGEYKMLDYSYRILIGGEGRTKEFFAAAPNLKDMDAQLKMLQSSFVMRVESGEVRRDDDGRIYADVKFVGVTTHNTQNMQLMGIDQARFYTSDQFLSCDLDSPTMFETSKDFLVNRGTVMQQILGAPAQMMSDVSGDMMIRASMAVDGELVRGQYIASSRYSISVTPGIIPVMELDFSGEFFLKLKS